MAFERFKDYIENREGNDTKEELHDYDDFRAEKQTARKSHQAKAMRAEAHTGKRVYPHSEKGIQERSLRSSSSLQAWYWSEWLLS